MAMPRGLKVSINHSRLADDDYASFGDDVSGIYFLNVLSNDAGSGAATLIGFWLGALPANLGDLLNPGALVTSFSTTTASGGTGATISVENNQLKYDFGEDADYNHLAVGQSLTDVFYYVMRLGNGTHGVARVEVTIVGENDGPVAYADVGDAVEAGTNPGQDATGNVLDNDVDVDFGAVLTVAEVNGDSANVGFAVSGLYGTLTLNADGSYTYVVDNANPDVDALNAGDTLLDVFTYTVTDEHGATATATLTITVHGSDDANSAPVAADGADDVDEDGVLNGTLPAATDDDGDTVTYAKAADPAHGTVIINADGTFTYTPDADFSGEDSFTFTVSDGNGGSNTYSYTVTVNPVADEPTLLVTNALGFENDEISLSIEAALTDTDGSETLSITIAGVPAGAILSAGNDNGDGTWTLTREELADLGMIVTLPPESGPAEFTLTVTATATETANGDFASTSKILLVSVTPLDEPEALNGNAIDGYLVGSTVFADANMNGVLDEGEAWTTTGSNGSFSLVGGSGPLVLYGGTDMSTGLPFTGLLKAPEGSTVVTPLTTLIAALMDGDPLLSLEDAQSAVKDAFGLADVDLTNYDPVQAALDGDTDALAVYAAGVQIQNIVVLAAAATGMTIEEAAAATFAAITAAIVADETVDLAAPSVQLLQAITGETDVSNLQLVVTAVNTEVSNAVTAGDNLGALTQMTQAAVVAQSEEAAAAANGEDTQTFVDNVADTVANTDVGVVGGAVTGTAGNDTLIGTAGNDALDGLGGNDLLIGGAGNDFLFGGAGNDTLVGGPGNDYLDGGENSAGALTDFDGVDYGAEGGPFGVTVNLALGTATDSFGDTDTLVNIERVLGTQYDDVLIGGDPTNFGTSRSELFEGRGGNDTIVGGIDNNMASYVEAPSGIVVNLSTSDIDLGGGDIIEAGTARDGYGTVDTLSNINRIRGSAHGDLIYGSTTTSGNERFEGMAGNDTIHGGGGIDYVMYTSSPGAVTVTFTGGGEGTASDGWGTTDIFTGIEGVRGSAFGDVLTGSDRTDQVERFEGMAGNDTIDGGGGNDQVEYNQSPTGVTVNLATGTALDGFGGTDTLTSIEFVVGSRFNDLIIGSDRTDVSERFTGLAGDDTIHGGGGIDYVMYQNSPAAVTVTFSNDVFGSGTAADGWGTTDNFTGIEGVRGSNFGDVLTGSDRTDQIERFEGMAGNDTINGMGGTDRLEFGQSPSGVVVNLSGIAVDVDGVIVQGGTALDGFGGTDTLISIEQANGSPHNDYFIGSNGNNRFDGGAGNDTVSYQAALSGVTVNLSIVNAPQNTGGGGTDILLNIENVIGSAFNDLLSGDGGPNLLVGGDGDDTLFGGLGNDTLIGGAGNDWLSPGGNDGGVGVEFIDGGEGIDTLDRSSATAGQNINLAAGTNGASRIVINVENAIGSAFNDTLIGDAGANYLFGGAGNDTLVGGAGNDVLDGGENPAGVLSDADTVDYGLEGGPNGVTVNLALGTATDSFGDTDTLLNIERVNGTGFDDVLIAGDPTSLGSGRSEQLEGRGGNDYLEGGDPAAGFMTQAVYAGAPGGIVVNLTSSDIDLGGGDIIEAGTARDGYGTVDTLVNINRVRGSNHADLMYGSDSLVGNERFEGGAGNDTIHGGGGLDYVMYQNSPGAVTVTFSNDVFGSGTAADGWGTTDVFTGIEGVRGSAFGDVLTGSDRTDQVERFEGMAGDDTIDGGGGLDRVEYGQSPTGVVVNLATGTASDGFGGTDTLIGIEEATGSRFDDVLIGDDGNNRLDGGLGNDSLVGGAGNDLLIGGDGDDTLIGGQGNDTLLGGAGNDTVSYQAALSGVTVNLSIVNAPQNTGGGGTDILLNIENVIGSAFNDLLSGDGGPNLLVGGDGDDTLFGGLGNDTLIGGAGNDWLSPGGNDGGVGVEFIDGGEGIDTLDRSSATAGQNINLAAGTNGASRIVINVENAIGSAFNDTLIGDAGANYLFGGAGNDTLVGGAGNDVLDGGENPAGVLSDADTVDYGLEGGPNGVTVNLALGTATDSFGDTDTLLNIERVNGTAFDDVLIGGDPSIVGSGRSELLEGRAGNDYLEGGDPAAGFMTQAVYAGAPGGIVVNLTSSDIDLGGGDIIEAGTARDGYGTVDTLVNINRVRGSNHADLIYGSDSLVGNERFEGGAGNDTIHGGGGIDYVMYQNSPGAVTVTLGSDGSGTASDGWGTTDVFTGIEGVRGSAFGDVLTGSDRTDQVERFEGMAGDDTIDGGGGLDRVEYGQSPTGVVVNLATGTASDGFGGTDTLISIEQATGSRFDDVLIGDAGNNRLDGGLGNDSLVGGAGHDLLIGGEGDDTLIGGQGNDILTGGTGTDTFVWAAAHQGSAGSPAVDTITDFDLDPGSDKLDLSALLVGASANETVLDDYLDFNFGGGDTTIDVRPTGSGGDMTQQIVLQGVNLSTIGSGSDSDIIASLLANNKLIV